MLRNTAGLDRAWVRPLGLICLLAAAFPLTVHASSIESVTCGQILEREFDAAHQVHDYKIMMEPGGTLNLRVVPIGGTLAVRAVVYEPASPQPIAESDYVHEIRLPTPKLSGRGIHTIRVTNSQYRSGGGDSRVGVYTLEISCVLSDGSKVEAGSQGGGLAGTPLQAGPDGSQGGAAGSGLGKYADDFQKVQAATAAAQQTVQVLSDVAKLAKGLWRRKKPAQEAAPAPAYPRPEDVMARGQQAQPVEAPTAPAVKSPSASARRMFPPLPLGTVLQGEISASSGAQGCRFHAKAGQKIDLAFERLTGNLGLVVSVFAPDQQLVFQTSVLASPRVSTTLQVPAAGEYTVEIASMGSASGSGTAPFSLRIAAAAR